MKTRKIKRPLFAKADEATKQEEQIIRKGSFKNFLGIYKGVRIPLLLYICAFLYDIFSSYVLTARTDADTQIAAGNFEDLGVIATWADCTCCITPAPLATCSSSSPVTAWSTGSASGCGASLSICL